MRRPGAARERLYVPAAQDRGAMKRIGSPFVTPILNVSVATGGITTGGGFTGGGLTGGGISKIAKRHGVKVKDIYRIETTFPAGKRTVTFYPGKLVLTMDKEEKPAV